MRARCACCARRQLGSIASLATETTGGDILVIFWPKHGLRSDFRMPNLSFKNFGGACPQTPLACSHLLSTRSSLISMAVLV